MYKRHNLEFNRTRLEFVLFFCILAYFLFIEIYDMRDVVQNYQSVNRCISKGESQIQECIS